MAPFGMVRVAVFSTIRVPSIKSEPPTLIVRVPLISIIPPSSIIRVPSISSEPPSRIVTVVALPIVTMVFASIIQASSFAIIASIVSVVSESNIIHDPRSTGELPTTSFPVNTAQPKLKISPLLSITSLFSITF